MMKSNVLLILCVITTLICSCNERVNNVDRPTIVSGQVINHTPNDPKVMLWNLGDRFNNNRVSVELGKDGRFKMENNGVKLLHNMTLIYGDLFTFFAAPGDSIHVMVDMAKMKTDELDAVCFSGDRADENNELYHYYSYLSSIIVGDYNTQLDMNLPPKAMIIQLNDRITVYKDSLSHYEALQKSPMSANVSHFIEVWFLRWLMQYRVISKITQILH